ncbi:MAG: ATP-binding protein [Hyphomicrobiaceae bacterium]|nr:PAS domain-containing protein [Hyphomicrobiaceae bacterium]
MLMCASVSIVCTLLVLLTDAATVSATAGQLRMVMLACLVVALGTMGAAAWLWPTVTGLNGEPVGRDDVATMRKDLLANEAIVSAENQVLIFWEQGQRAQLMKHTLHSVPGLPTDAQALEHFGDWLEGHSAIELKEGLDALFAEGRAFNLMLRTTSGGHLEADGRAAGGRAVLRLRDLVGYRRDLARIVEQHRELKREIRANRALLDALPMPVWMRDAEGRLVWVNSAYIKAVDAKTFTEVRDAQVELLDGRDIDKLKSELAAGRGYSERLPVIIGGERKAHDVLALPVDDASVGAAIDVAAIENVQGEHEREIAAYDRTLHRVASGVAMFGADGRLAFFNKAFCDIWQLDEDWLNTRPSDGEVLDRLRQLSRLPQVVNYRDWRAQVLAKARTEAGHEDWWHLLGGRTVHVISEQRPDGGVTYLFDDATERIELESRYNSLIASQSETIDSLKEAVAVFAPDGRLKLFNRAFARIWQLHRTGLQEGPHVDDVVRHCAALFDDGHTWTRLTRAITGITDRRQQFEGQITRPDGVVLDYAASPLPDGAMMLTFTDVTDAKAYERALIERNEALMAGDRLKSQFIGHISYELRSPLQNIIGFSELLASPMIGPLNEKQTEYLGDLSASSKTLLAIINDILDLATIDAGGLELKTSSELARPIIDAAVVGVRERAHRARLSLDIRVEDAETVFVADAARIKQVLYNLVSNAIGFSSPGGTVKISSWRANGMRVFSVEDRGVGIPREEQSRVFERFESRSQGGKHRGAGLGLAIVKSLVELHGGSMALESEPGQGTWVTVRLPEKGSQKYLPDPVMPEAAMSDDPLDEISEVA